MKKHTSSPFRSASRALALEPRLLFDGAGAVAIADHAFDHVESGKAYMAEAQRSEAHPTTESRPGESLEKSAHASALYVIDARVTDLQSILASLPTDATVRIIGAEEAGLNVVGAELAKGERFDAVHIISHGTPGSLALGRDMLNHDTLPGHATTLQSWSTHLTDEADLLLYGCDIAQSEAGERFINAIAQLTGADVTASINPTGAALKGGDWVLEKTTGRIEAGLLSVTGYAELLAATAINDSNEATPRITPEDTPLSIAGISITDADNPASMTVRVQTTGGTSTVTLSGASISSGSNGSNDFTLSGSLTDINATLASLSFTNTPDQNRLLVTVQRSTLPPRMSAMAEQRPKPSISP